MGDFLKSNIALQELLECYSYKSVVEYPKVSVIIPAYNVEKYISRCLLSLVKQTLKEIEIIVVNDGSTDDTLSISSVFASCDSRVTVISQENQKQGAARNRGIEIAKGEFIGFVDADDWVDEDYFEKMYNTAIKHGVNMAAANATRDYKNKVKAHLMLNEEKTFYGANSIVKAIKNNLVVHSKIFRRKIIKDLRFEEGVFYEDAPFAIRAIDLCNSLVTVPHTTYHYFSNPKSTIKQGLSEKNKNDKVSTNLDLINYCEENNIDIGQWGVLKERHLLWTIKHYKNYKDFYIFGFKLFRQNIPFDNSKVFVVYNTACFGDVLLCNSLCQNIKNVFPESKIIFVCDKPFYEVAKYQQAVDDVVVYDKNGEHKGIFGLIKFVKNFKYKNSYASIITYKNFRNFSVSHLVRSHHVIMANSKKSELSTQEKHNLLLQPLTNKKIKNYPMKYNVPYETKEYVNKILTGLDVFVVLCTTSKKIEKDMPINTAIDLIQKLNQKNKKVVYVGVGEKSIKYGERLKKAGCEFMDLTNKTSITQLGEVLAKAELLISVDTGTMHMGCAVGTPTLALFYDQQSINTWAPKSEIYNSKVFVNEISAENILNKSLLEEIACV